MEKVTATHDARLNKDEEGRALAISEQIREATETSCQLYWECVGGRSGKIINEVE